MAVIDEDGTMISVAVVVVVVAVAVVVVVVVELRRDEDMGIEGYPSMILSNQPTPAPLYACV